MPGDLVRVERSDDILIKEGNYGVIEGQVGEKKLIYSVVFNMSPLPWWHNLVVSCSGGPVRLIEAKKLKPTGEKKPQLFQYWPGIPGEERAKTKTITVNVFTVDLTQ